MRTISFALAALMLAALADAATAASCTQRHALCLKNCASRTAVCTNACAEALPKCRSTGCWVTPQSNKCGYSKG
ncbi:MAG: hypothetical protein ACOY4O_11595 [Pseudomonadota bacterium]|jgi:hypothetical protein